MFSLLDERQIDPVKFCISQRGSFRFGPLGLDALVAERAIRFGVKVVEFCEDRNYRNCRFVRMCIGR